MRREIVDADRSRSPIRFAGLPNLRSFQIERFTPGPNFRGRANPSGDLAVIADLHASVARQSFKVIWRESDALGSGEKRSAQEEPRPAKRHADIVTAHGDEHGSAQHNAEEQEKLIGGREVKMWGGRYSSGEGGRNRQQG